MAEAISNNFELLTCPICLDLLKEPATLHCGHSYCMGCIKGCWNQEDHKGVYSCPQCRQTFSPRPLLKKNNIVAELVAQIKRTRVQRRSSSLAHHFAGPGDVECDVCTGKKLKAVKSCLECLVSYCDTHYKVHNDVNPGRQHSVIDATSQLQERICSDHKKVYEIFCRTDQSCICYVCMMHSHKGHDIVTAAAERTDREKQWRQTQRKYKQGIQEREKELQELRKAVDALKSSAQTAVEESERAFTEMICSIEKRRSEVTELIRAQEKAEVSRVEGVLKQLEQEIAELKKRDAELEQLSHTEDHIHFLKTYQSAVSIPPQSVDLFSVTFNHSLSFEAVKNSVSTLKEQLENICNDNVLKISAAVTEVHLTEPVTRGDFLQYSHHFKLDLNTAHRNLHLSDESRSVEWRVQAQSYPDHNARFDPWWQVLCRNSVNGRRSYWEVELLRKWGGCIAVSYKNINRKGRDNKCKFGRNNQSWRLDVFSCSASFWHDNKKTELPLVRSSRIGVYVDYKAGILAFYSVSDTMTLLHRVQTTFTLPLYPGFCLFNGSSMKLL